ncbi:MAG TPA: heme biosynthesis HemY N-terminal domain-containing protein [Rhizomicrobium sp.]|nr:heme biosynthesis HemY N-terminal domain-containing protein [Rhizomicrobium sp.]
MIRLLAILIGAALIALCVAWIADRQGELVYVIENYQLRTSAGGAIGLAIAFAAIIATLTRIVAIVLSGPGAFGRWNASRRTRRGHEALSRGLVAAAAGDVAEARKLAKKAQALLGTPPLSLLLTAQAAQLDGDEEAQDNAYRAMLAHPETEFLGLRGLFMKAMRQNENSEAMQLAERAHALKPRAAWAANALFDLKSAHHEWGDAKAVLENATRAKLIDANVARRRRAVLLTAEALDAEARGEGDRALKLALDALDLSPALAPAASLAARKLGATGRSWRAQDIIEAAWAQTPHPDLAAAYAAIKPAESAEARARRLIGLAHLKRDHFESRMLEAEQAVNLAEWAEGRRVLAPLAHGFASARVCALMAEIEQGQRHDAAAAHAWLARAVRAPHDAEWRCTNCKWGAAEWQAVCKKCGAFDTLEWSAPGADLVENFEGEHFDSGPAAELDAPYLQEASVREEELAAEEEAAMARSVKKRVPAEPTGGFVVLPRPPDDPGPDGYDFEPKKPAGRGGIS